MKRSVASKRDAGNELPIECNHIIHERNPIECNHIIQQQNPNNRDNPTTESYHQMLGMLERERSVRERKKRSCETSEDEEVKMRG
ncbi:hypothetical protein Tco_0420515 [Tanacetum coccineum]